MTQQRADILRACRATGGVKQCPREATPDEAQHLLLIVVGRYGLFKFLDEFARLAMPAGGDKRDQVMQTGKDERAIAPATCGQVGQFLPAPRNIDTEHIEPEEQRDSIAHVAEVLADAWPDFAVIEIEGRLEGAAFHVKQCRVPAHVQGEIVASAPDRALRLDPGETRIDPPGHFMDMTDRMNRPGVERLKIKRMPAHTLSFAEGALLFECKCATPEQEAIAWRLCATGRQGTINPHGKPAGVAGHEADRMGELGEQNVLRTRVEMAFADFGRRAETAPHGQAQRRDKGGLAGARSSLAPRRFGGLQMNLRQRHRLGARQRHLAKPAQGVGADAGGIGGKRCGKHYVHIGTMFKNAPGCRCERSASGGIAG